MLPPRSILLYSTIWSCRRNFWQSQQCACGHRLDKVDNLLIYFWYMQSFDFLRFYTNGLFWAFFPGTSCNRCIFGDLIRIFIILILAPSFFHSHCFFNTINGLYKIWTIKNQQKLRMSWQKIVSNIFWMTFKFFWLKLILWRKKSIISIIYIGIIICIS